MGPASVLVVSGDPFVETLVRVLLPGPGLAVTRIKDRDNILGQLTEQPPRVIVVDAPVVDQATTEFLRHLHDTAGLPLIVLAPDGDRLQGDLEPAVRVLGRPPESGALAQA